MACIRWPCALLAAAMPRGLLHLLSTARVVAPMSGGLVQNQLKMPLATSSGTLRPIATAIAPAVSSEYSPGLKP
jgi:hypothetical protein